ncbi:MAG: 3-deoxy-D-manno-octulosonic acid transferase [Pseudorhodobacter sp.]
MAEFPSLKLRLALLAYGLLWAVGLPFVLFYLWRRGRRDADYTAHLAERFGRYGTPMPGAVWVHAVSLGEFRSALPLIRALLARGDRLVITHFTPAGRRESTRVLAAEIAAGQARVVWVPFESSLFFNGFFRTFQPKYGLVMEIEIWPRMILAARAAGVPLFMCNAQYPSKSFARDGRTGLRSQLMRGFAGALVKSDLQRDRFASVGVAPIAVTGELRFDQPIPAAHLAAGARLKPARPVFAIASAVEGEDDGYIQTIKALRAKGDLSLVVYVPRAPERFDAVAIMLQDAGLTMARRSGCLGPDLSGRLPDGIDVFLGDSLGEMYFYLSLADRVVVGGGFTPKGAHNIIEPLALRKPVLTGPEVWTIEYPFAEAEAAGVARKLPDFNALAEALAYPQDPTPEAIEAFFAAHSGATQKTLAAIDRFTRR